MMQKALFLDRDGVINIDHGYVCSRDRFDLVDGVLDVMRHFQQRGYLLIVVTNQAGIAKGHYTEADFLAFDDWMRRHLLSLGITITRTYHCPFHTQGSVPEYVRDSADRKPNPGMILKAVQDWKIAVHDSLLIGDKHSDMEAAARASIPRRIHLGPDSRSPLATEYHESAAALRSTLVCAHTDESSAPQSDQKTS